MEGTSGAAERVSLRGAAREAALAPVVIAKAVSFPGGLASSSGYQREPRELHAGPAGRPMQIGCPVGLAQAGSPGELDMGTRQSRVCPAKLASPASIAASFTTAGVRADRVGAKLLLRAIATGGAGKSESGPAPDP
jgi:hypothetical protein